MVLTAFTKGNKKPQNSAFVIDKSGNVLMKYSKVHTCDFADERNIESGKAFKVCDFEGIQLGIMAMKCFPDITEPMQQYLQVLQKYQPL